MKRRNVLLTSIFFAFALSFWSFFNLKVSVGTVLKFEVAPISSDIKIFPNSATVVAKFLCPFIFENFDISERNVILDFSKIFQKPSTLDGRKLAIDVRNFLNVPTFCEVESLSEGKVEFEFVQMTTKVLFVRADVIGKPADKFFYTVSVTPDKVIAQGPRRELEKINFVWTETIDINERKESFSIEVPLRTINIDANFKPKTVRVFVKIYKLQFERGNDEPE